MNLEVVEQKCLVYLKQVANPLADVQTLYRHLAEDPAIGEIGYSELLSFLRRHELFKVVEPVGMALDAAGQELFEEAGISVSPRVILCTRVPTQAELAKAIEEQLDRMAEALLSAMRAADSAGDEARRDKLAAVLKQTEALRERLKAFL